MGLLSKLTTIGEGSTLSYSDGNTPLINKLSTKESPLHYNSYNLEPGYSVNGTDALYVNSLHQGYEDGKNTSIPEPTTLDLTDSLTADPDNKPKYTYVIGNTYSNLYNKF